MTICSSEQASGFHPPATDVPDSEPNEISLTRQHKPLGNDNADELNYNLPGGKKEEELPKTLINLPIELQAHIFTFLPWESHLIVSRVCTLWDSIIQTSQLQGHRYDFFIPRLQDGPSLGTLSAANTIFSRSSLTVAFDKDTGIIKSVERRGPNGGVIQIPLDSFVLKDPFFYPFLHVSDKEAIEELQHQKDGFMVKFSSGVSILGPWSGNVRHLKYYHNIYFSRIDSTSISVRQMLESMIKVQMRPQESDFPGRFVVKHCAPASGQCFFHVENRPFML